MTLRHTITLSFAAALFAATANAAPPRHAASHGAHTVAAHSRTHARTAAPATGPDHSADALNAQSLSRAQSATQ